MIEDMKTRFTVALSMLAGAVLGPAPYTAAGEGRMLPPRTRRGNAKVQEGKGAAVMELGSDDRDLVHLEASSTPKSETVADVRPLIQNLGAPSIAQIEKLIGELHEARNLLESERERIQRETARYIKFTQMASASVKIIFDTLSGWRQAGHPLSEFVTRSPADDSTGRMGRSFGSAPNV
jgi:hypothetical protein